MREAYEIEDKRIKKLDRQSLVLEFLDNRTDQDKQEMLFEYLYEDDMDHDDDVLRTSLINDL